MVPQNFIDIFLIFILIVKVFIIIELNRMKVFQFDYNSHNMVFGQLTPKWIAPRLGLGFESRLGLVLGLGDNQTIVPEENCPLFRVRVWVRVSFGVGGQFSSGAIVLEPNVINILKIFIAIQWNNILILKNFFIIILLINIIIWSSHGRRE